MHQKELVLVNVIRLIKDFDLKKKVDYP